MPARGRARHCGQLELLLDPLVVHFECLCVGNFLGFLKLLSSFLCGHADSPGLNSPLGGQNTMSNELAGNRLARGINSNRTNP